MGEKKYNEVKSEQFMKKVCMSEMKAPNRRGRPPGRWKDRVKKYMSERGPTRGEGLEQARRESLDRETWSHSCHGHPTEGHSRREQGVRAINRQTSSKK